MDDSHSKISGTSNRSSIKADPSQSFRDIEGAAPPRAHPGVDWNLAWDAAWKPHVDNVWFAYQADVYTKWLQRSGLPPGARILKTDGFDEACGFRPLRSLDHLVDMGAIVRMDISPRILVQAALRQQGSPSVSCATDALQLAFRSASFDLIFSPSTLDHFESEETIVRALRELHTILRPQGRLLITLDNPANPTIRLRQWLHRFSGPIGGVIPFPMGQTLSHERLRHVLEHNGFEIVESSYILHAPRLLLLWVGEYAARWQWHHLSRRLGMLLHVCERLGASMPTRRWSGHYVIADCRKR